jgi:hypothetical protein
VPIEWDDEWASELLCTVLEKKKNLLILPGFKLRTFQSVANLICTEDRDILTSSNLCLSSNYRKSLLSIKVGMLGLDSK